MHTIRVVLKNTSQKLCQEVVYQSYVYNFRKNGNLRNFQLSKKESGGRVCSCRESFTWSERSLNSMPQETSCQKFTFSRPSLRFRITLL
jgi:hypothetical protein